MVTKRKIIKYSTNFLLVCLLLWSGLFLINHKIQKTETRSDFKSRWVTYHWEDGRISIGKAFGKAGASKVISVDWQSEKHLPSPSNSISQKEIHETLAVSLKAKASAKENNAILKKAFDFARKHPGTDLIFPKGHFKLGTLTPDKDYQVLPSHTSLIGRQTTLLISGSEYWLGLPSGPKAEDGVSDFRMTGLHFKAQNLVKGDKLLIMVDHGKDWFISHNRFTLVHQKGSHVFDLGSLQNSRFSENEFYGYAPGLDSQELFKKGHNLHDFYAEAIQLDAADPNGVWDAGIIKSIQANNHLYNQTRFLCNGISIDHNHFLPYKNEKGNIIAYGASIGQHSSKVGQVSIRHNVFENCIVSQFSPVKSWVLAPIHVLSDQLDSFNNVFKE